MKVEVNGQRFEVYNEDGKICIYYICDDLTARLIVGNQVFKKFGPLNYVSRNDFPEGLVEKLVDLFYLFNDE